MTSPHWSPGPSRVPRNLQPKAFHKKVIMTSNFGPLMGVVYRPNADEVAEAGISSLGWTFESGESILLSLRWVNKTGLLVDLGDMTVAELDTFEDFIHRAISKARPIAEARDAIAREAESNGDYSYARSNRPDPRLSIKPGEE